jgi:anti-anti-sigma factor
VETFEFAIEEGVIVLLPDGDVTSRSYPDIECMVGENLSRGFNTIVAVMDRVDFIDSAGLVFLLRLKKMVETSGGILLLNNPSYFVQKRLKELYLDRIFNVVRDGEYSCIDIRDSSAGKKMVPVKLG